MPTPQHASEPVPVGVWAGLVDKIQQNDPAGMEELYRVFLQGVRYYLCRQLGPQDLEDRIHDTFLIVAQAIRRGDLREPERLMGYVRTVVRRQVAAQIDLNIQTRKNQSEFDAGLPVADKGENPEQSAIERQHRKIAAEVLREISPRDREILVRFYLREQRPEQICDEMKLTDTQFRLLKSRAKARFADLGRKKLSHQKLFRFWRDVTGGDGT